MKTLRRNQTLIKYATFKERAEILDANNYRTGQFTNTYNEQVSLYAYVSAARGETSQDMVGVNANYTKTIIVDDVNCPIDEKTILWVDDLTSAAHDYIVVQKAKSLNSISYAIRKVEVTTPPVIVPPTPDPEPTPDPNEGDDDNAGTEP